MPMTNGILVSASAAAATDASLTGGLGLLSSAGHLAYSECLLSRLPGGWQS